MRVGDLELRPATLDDATFSADLRTAVRPNDAEDPASELHSWRIESIDNVIERWIALHDGRPVGKVSQRHVPWDKMPERYASVSAELLPEVRTAARFDALLAHAEERARAAGAKILTIWVWEDDRLLLDVVTARGFVEERRERFWECDLVTNRDRIEKMTDVSRRRMRELGFEILTLAQDRDPERYRKIWRMSEEAESDIPTTVPHTETSWELFTEWMREPGLREDRQWIARRGDDIVGISQLSYPPTRGVVETDWTGTARAVRGQGVARALKCETVMQAIALGVDRVRTDNDGENAPILHLNESMGYVRRADMIQLLKKGA
ncbi:MAG: GNAT family N-acetyltransferase [Chloroflexota bacterium]